mmetsp:Transcript_98232/g.227792  ORF Transcript_98232/g.227792 Transcript_98232/m.227792 type:complete len:207 (-) Transcript_98232:118-738(-)
MGSRLPFCNCHVLITRSVPALSAVDDTASNCSAMQRPCTLSSSVTAICCSPPPATSQATILPSTPPLNSTPAAASRCNANTLLSCAFGVTATGCSPPSARSHAQIAPSALALKTAPERPSTSSARMAASCACTVACRDKTPPVRCQRRTAPSSPALRRVAEASWNCSDWMPSSGCSSSVLAKKVSSLPLSVHAAMTPSSPALKITA